MAKDWFPISEESPKPARNGRRPGDNRTKGVTQKILAMAVNDMPVADIAKISGTTKSNVTATLRRYGFKLDEVLGYQSTRPLIFAGYQKKFLAAMTDTKISKASLQALVDGVKKLNEMERLESGKSTENVSVKTDMPEALKAAIDRIASRKL
jgi:hypothetical protein